MPQIWLDNEELGKLFGCSPETARQRSIGLGWPRRRSRDGLSRARLPPEIFESMLLDHAARALAEEVADRSVAELRDLLARARRGPAEPSMPQSACG